MKQIYPCLDAIGCVSRGILYRNSPSGGIRVGENRVAGWVSGAVNGGRIGACGRSIGNRDTSISAVRRFRSEALPEW